MASKKHISHLSSILIVALMLFILGVTLGVLLQASKIGQKIKENIVLQVELKDNLSKKDIFQVSKKIRTQKEVKKVDYVSKQQASKLLKEKLGEDFEDILGYNPLYASFNVYIQASYAHPKNVTEVVSKMLSNPNIVDVHYQTELFGTVYQNLKKLYIAGIGFSIILLILVVSSIDNAIRLSMFSNRFLIKSMQLVGSTKWFITKPFILRGIYRGFLSGILAALSFICLFYFLEKEFPTLTMFEDLYIFVAIIISMILIGVFISWLSTYRSVHKYLKTKIDDLY